MYTLKIHEAQPVFTFSKNKIHTDHHPFWRKKGKMYSLTEM